MLPPMLVESRAREGPYVKPKRFDLDLSRRIAQLEREYDVTYDPERPVPDDPTLPKSVYEAGLRLALEVGLLVVDEKRVVKFSEEELVEALRRARRELPVGRGLDARVLRCRSPGSRDRPFVFGGLAGTPTPLDYFYESALSYALEPLIDGIDHGSVNCVWGVAVKGYAPSEALAAIEELRAIRRALEDAGRPGMHVLAAESSVTSTGSLTAMGVGLLREGDAQLLPILNELKTSYDQLTKALVGLVKGVHGASLIDPIVGGFARGAAGSAICSVAEILLAQAAYGASYHLVHPVHIRLQATSTRECLWVESVVGQAGELIGVPLVGDVWPGFGAGTREVFYEIAANTVAVVASGLNVLGPTPTAGSKPHGTGLEARFMAEVAVATAEKGLGPSKACDLVLELLKLYESKLASPDYGRPFPELYELSPVRPKPEWRKVYEEVRRELEDVGVPLLTG